MAQSLLGGGSGKLTLNQGLSQALYALGGSKNTSANIRALKEDNRKAQREQLMQEALSVVGLIDSGNIQSAKERVGAISVQLQNQGLDPSNFMNLDEMLTNDPNGAREMILDAARGAVDSGELKVQPGGRWANLLGKKKDEKAVTYRPMIDGEGNLYEVRTYTDADGQFQKVAMDGTDLTGKKLYGEKSAPFKKKQKEMEASFESSDKEDKAYTRSQTNYLRDKIQDQNKDFRTTQIAYERVQSVGRNATPASDLALIFQFMKILDPTSVVRESEFKTVADAKAWLVKTEDSGVVVPAPIANAIRKASTGNLLENPQREDILTQISGLFAGAQTSADQNMENILQQADIDGIDRANIIGKERLAKFQERVELRANPVLEETEYSEDTISPDEMSEEDLITELNNLGRNN